MQVKSLSISDVKGGLYPVLFGSIACQANIKKHYMYSGRFNDFGVCPTLTGTYLSDAIKIIYLYHLIHVLYQYM